MSMQVPPFTLAVPGGTGAGPALDSERLSRALVYALQVHGGRGAPSAIAAALATAALVLEFGGDDDQTVAALLLDVIGEGGVFHASPLNRYFGARVLRLVLDGADVIGRPCSEHPEHLERHLMHLDEIGSDSLLVNACAKLHNASRVLRELQCDATVLERFAAGRDEVLGYYRSLSELFARRQAGPAAALAKVVADIEALAG